MSENRGIARLPGFFPSLVLLVEREQYSLHDIGMMFGVSRERISKLCQRYGVPTPKKGERGLNAVRVWDDTKNRFTPVRVRSIRRAEKREAVASRKATRLSIRAERMARVVNAIHELRKTHGRDPGWPEIANALGLNYTLGAACARVLNYAFPTSAIPTRRKLRAIRKASGMRALRRGAASPLFGLRCERRTECSA